MFKPRNVRALKPHQFQHVPPFIGAMDGHRGHERAPFPSCKHLPRLLPVPTGTRPLNHSLNHSLGTPARTNWLPRYPTSPNGRIVGMTVAMTVAIVPIDTTRGSTPANLPGESSMRELRIAKVKRRAPVEGNVVDAPVPDGRVCHPVGREGHDRANDCAGEDVVPVFTLATMSEHQWEIRPHLNLPVVKLINCQGTANEACAKDRGVDGDQLPHSRMIVGKDLELGVQVQVQIDEPRERSRRVSRRHRLKAIINLIPVTSADLRRIVNLLEPSGIIPPIRAASGKTDIRLADSQEMWAQAPDEPLDEDLEHGGGDEGVEQADDGVVDVPEGADADLHDQEDEDGDEGGE